MENSRAFRELQCDVFLADCSARKVLALLAEKWTLLVIHALSERSYRTAELRRRIGGVSEKMLIQALRRLEECGLVARTNYSEVPPRVEYALTSLGYSLSSVVRELDRWIETHAFEIEDWVQRSGRAA
ncbi:winged helix-turn-helix transcriptional regulator [Sphingomonas sanxanigenens]|uniref:winged helix-turn-helix transcriptional regulator n=1 Tax=Sphingomonas sanxanigenens TaxID=397260 RepID=UPI00063D3F1F|nr:helix-turn-helix domain-containing protein [Sphingomonas sanxanigenens]